MATKGTATARFQGVGGVYYKTWELQEKSDVDIPTEIAALRTGAQQVAETYSTVTKGQILSLDVKVDAPVIGVTPEAGAYKNRAAAVLGTVDGDPSKKIAIYVQAARDGIFTGNDPESTIVDVADADLVAYFAQLNNHVLVSDGEIPHEDPVSGYRLDRANSSKD